MPKDAMGGNAMEWSLGTEGTPPAMLMIVLVGEEVWSERAVILA